MASVYYLFDDALHIADDIVQKYSQQDRSLKENHLAAIFIQRAYRGYVVRKYMKVMHAAATTLQKYIRGWLARYGMPERLLQEYDKRSVDWYHWSATKLQAWWKGILVRRKISIKQIMETKRREEQQLLKIAATLSDDEEEIARKLAQQEEDKDNISDAGSFPGRDKFAKERILAVMFDRHHLLSTEIRKGILGNHRELVEIEKVLASLPWTDYMKKLRKLYNKYYKAGTDTHRPYLFTNKKLRQQEDILRLRDKSNDKKEIQIDFCATDKRKPFCLNIKKTDKVPYERRLFLDGKYFVPEKMIVRSEDKSKNLSDRDFELTLRKVAKDSDVPPYYADFWYQECTGHNMD